jgi:hypothetical protein
MHVGLDSSTWLIKILAELLQKKGMRKRMARMRVTMERVAVLSHSMTLQCTMTTWIIGDLNAMIFLSKGKYELP